MFAAMLAGLIVNSPCDFVYDDSISLICATFSRDCCLLEKPRLFSYLVTVRCVPAAGAAMSAVAALSSAPAAQFPMFSIPSAVAGVVQDQTGAVIPNAKVDVIADASGKTLTMHTDSFGRFQAGLLPAGGYTIRVESPGFQLLTRHDSLSAGMQLKLSATLRVGVLMGEVIQVDYAK